MLTFARVLQGFGGAALMSVNTALIRIIYPQRFLGRGMGINSLIVAVSTAAGPTVAAAVLSVASWKWLFLINVPVCLAALYLAFRFLPDNTQKAQEQRFDIPSAIMNALTFGLMISALSGFSQGQSNKLVLAELVALVFVGFLFIRRQLKMTVPLLPVDLLRIPIFFSLAGHIRLLFLRTNAGDGLAALLPANGAAPRRSGNWPAADAVAVGYDGYGPDCRAADRTLPLRAVGRDRSGDVRHRPLLPRTAA